MKQFFVLTSIFSVLLPGVIAIIRFRKISPVFYPFLFLIWVACANEMLSLLYLVGVNPSVNNNIYVLLEGLMLMWFFKNLLFYPKYMNLLYILTAIIIITWIWENILLGKITFISSYYRILYSFFVVLASILTINKLISTTRTNILREPVFILCGGFILFFTIKILIEAFWLYGISLGPRFQGLIYQVVNWVNIITHLIFALAILWMPRKQVFTMPS